MAQPLVRLPDDLDAFVEEQVRLGRYRDRGDVIARAVRRLRDDDENAKLARMDAKIQAGIDELDRGEGVVVSDLDAYFDDLLVQAAHR